MDCSLREASRKKQSIAPKKAFFGPIRTKKRPKFLTLESFWCSKNGLIFCKPKNGSFDVSSGHVFWHFLSFYTMQLGSPKSGSMSAPQSVQEMVHNSNQLGGRGPHNIHCSMLGFIGQKCLITPFGIG